MFASGYQFNHSLIRARPDEHWFVAKDVCNILNIQNPTQAINILDEDERTMLNIGRHGKANTKTICIRSKMSLV
ncbi:MAG: hypothetical protein GH151_13885 [Bacteroidetes bacterium]|nr:hypothetical protein [Bacteroidota bacterium]